MIALKGIVRSYRELAATGTGRLNALLVTAAPLTDAQAASIRQAVAERFDREVDLSVRVDRSLLGGMRLEAGDTVIDGTLDRRLETFRRKLTESSLFPLPTAPATP
jgi:F-type H+-transporting ATPase subunit delta